MALLFMEGFESYATDDWNSLAEDSRCTSVYSSNINTVKSGGRIDGQMLYLGVSVNTKVSYSFANTSDTYYVGFAIKSNAYADREEILFMLDDANTQNALYMLDGGFLQVARGATTIATSTNSCSVNTWHYIVLKIKLSNSVGTVELWIDGIKGIDETGLDTQDAGNAYVNSIAFFHGDGTMYIDDLYIGDTSGSDMTDQVGDCHIELLLPNANGNRNDFTRVGGGSNNYEAVDEGGGGDGDTTYNHSDTATDAELYGTGSIAGDVGSVYAVQVYAKLRKEDAGARTVNMICRSSTTEGDSSAFGITTDYLQHTAIYENDPNGGGAWTESTANSAEVGFEIAS